MCVLEGGVRVGGGGGGRAGAPEVLDAAVVAGTVGEHVVDYERGVGGDPVLLAGAVDAHHPVEAARNAWDRVETSVKVGW